MTRRLLLLASPGRLSTWPIPDSRCVDLIVSAAAGASAGKPEPFLEAFDPAMPGYEQLRADVTGLIRSGGSESLHRRADNEGDERPHPGTGLGAAYRPENRAARFLALDRSPVTNGQVPAPEDGTEWGSIALSRWICSRRRRDPGHVCGTLVRTTAVWRCPSVRARSSNAFVLPAATLVTETRDAAELRTPGVDKIKHHGGL